ncbi:MAG: LssY C-terminal domain-containing protein [Elusimicrobiota bacterium]|nr:MAG: LssY C-terminal domain-containing protein [Elusimicrobiota bacterium]
MRRVFLAVPVLFLALSLDRVLPERPAEPAPRRAVASAEAEIAALPVMNKGRLGREGNPLNVVFVGNEIAVREALTTSGWTEVPGTIRRSLRLGLGELIRGRPVASFPPMNEYWLEGRRQDMNWSVPTKFLSARHHFRLWDTGLRDPQGRALWWGAGDYDLSIRWRDLSHVRDPDLDAERDWIAASLKDSPRLTRVTLVPHPSLPREGANDKGYKFHTDGRVALIELE